MAKKGKSKIIRGLGFIMAISFFGSCASEPPRFSEDEWLVSVKATDISMLYANHYDEKSKAFFNPWMSRPEVRRGFNMFSRNKMTFPEWSEELYTWRENSYEYLQNPAFEHISFAGHASFIIQMDSNTIMTDPFFSNRAATVSKEVKIKFDYVKLPERPVVLLSHNHYDHLDKKSIKKLIKKNAVFLVPLKLKRLMERWGAKDVHELDWWESININNVTYTFVPAQHWSIRLSPGNGSAKTLWGGWVIEGSKTIYFSGDTGYFRGFEEIGRRWEIDYALLGAGAYEPRWFMHFNHMSPSEFIMAADDLGAKISIPMHLGVISLSAEPINYPLYVIDEFVKENPEYSERIELLRVGEYLIME